MKNKLIDLNDHLFMQLERLNEEKLSGVRLREEVERSKAMTAVSREIIDNGRLAMDAFKMAQNIKDGTKAPAMLGLDSDNG
jgi:hypothetical protein